MNRSISSLILCIFQWIAVEAFIFAGTRTLRSSMPRVQSLTRSSTLSFGQRLASTSYNRDIYAKYSHLCAKYNDDDDSLVEDEDLELEKKRKPSYENEDWDLSKSDTESQKRRKASSSRTNSNDESENEEDESDAKRSKASVYDDDIDVQTFKFPSASDLKDYEVDENFLAWKMPKNAVELDDPDPEDAVPIFMLLYILHKEMKDVNIKNIMEEHMKYAKGFTRWKHSEAIEMEDGIGVAMMFAGHDMNDIEDTKESLKQFMDYDPLCMNQLVFTWTKMQLYPVPESFPLLDGKNDVNPEELME